jgi:hypothetical protein
VEIVHRVHQFHDVGFLFARLKHRKDFKPS